MLIIVSSAITFALLSSAGGDAFSLLRENPQVSAQTVESLKLVYGLDRPMPVRYLSWLGGVMTGDLGESFYFRTPVSGLVLSRLTSTLAISLVALALAVVFSITLCFLSIRYRSRWLSRIVEGVTLLSASAPRLVLALIALALTVSVAAVSTFWLAAVVLAVPLVAIFLAQLMEGASDVMREDFITLARAKGLSERVVILRHAVRAILNPVLTVIGLAFGALLGGSVIVESVLGRPGIGLLMVNAVRSRDIPLLMGTVLVASIAVWLGNALAEILQMLNDRRLLSAETD